MKTCPNCSSELQQDYRFCPWCGVSVKDKPAKQGGKVASQPRSVNPFYIVVLLILAGIFILYVSGVFDSATSVNTSAPAAGVPQGGVAQGGPSAGMDFSADIARLEAEYKKDTTDISVILNLANLLNDSGQYTKAIEYYDRYLKYNPKNADVWVDRGVCYYQMHDLHSAKSSMLEGLKKQPEHQIAHLNLGIVSLSSGDMQAAKEYWSRAVEINANSETGRKAKEFLTSHVK